MSHRFTATLVLYCAALLVLPACGLPQSMTRYFQQMQRELAHQAQSSTFATLGVLDSASGPVQELYYDDQSLNHFDGADIRTWSQRYFVRDEFFNGNGPVFICVGGEGPPLTKAVLNASVHCNDAVELAPKLGALLVALEHRYYGKSIPTPDFSTDNLQYLAAHQALGDLAQFHGFISEKYQLDPVKNRWVSFGGSYPGMLSGWFRLKFPNLVWASVSSSSPVRAQLNFEGYNDVVNASLAAPIVGGSDACAAAVSEGHGTVGEMLQTANGRSQLAAMFNLCNTSALDDPNNRADWAGQGVVYIPAQENDPSCTDPVCNIEKVCQLMTDTSKGSPIERLAALSKIQNNAECVVVDHQASVNMMLNTTVAGGTARIWYYQTCTEFAFYQTCDIGTQCPYTQGISNLQSFTDLCKLAYNISVDTITRRVAFSNAYWGADQPAGSRILFPNGQIDPWHYLGVLKSPAPSEPTLWVKGASHHFWTHPSKPTDSPEIVAARETIWKQVTDWLLL